MSQQSNKFKGFTIIELLLAMSFIAVLLIAIAMLTINISNLYTRGITFKELNQVGSEVSSDIKRTISESRVDAIEPMRKSNHSGSLCLGKYSYVWNEPTKIKNPDGTTIRYQGKPIRFVKIRDENKDFCNPSYPTTIPPLSDFKDLLSIGGDRDLAVYDMNISPNPSSSTDGRELYTVDLTLGTGDRNQIIGNSTCKPPTDTDTGDEYCAINKFTIVAQVGNTYNPEEN